MLSSLARIDDTDNGAALSLGIAVSYTLVARERRLIAFVNALGTDSALGIAI